MGKQIKSLLCIQFMHFGPDHIKITNSKDTDSRMLSKTNRHYIFIIEITSFLRPHSSAHNTFTYLAAIRSLSFLQRFFRAFCLSLSRAILGSILSAGASTMCRMLYDARSSLDGSTPSCWCRTASWCFWPRKWLKRYTSEPIWKWIHQNWSIFTYRNENELTLWQVVLHKKEIIHSWNVWHH